MYSAKVFLDALADSKLSHLQLRASRAPLRQLLDAVDGLLNVPTEEQEREFSSRKFAISWYWEQLKPVLFGELSVQNCYLVWPKRAYDIELLAEDGPQIFSPEARAVLTPAELYDVAQAGRCLAFEVPTAAAFHIFRAADSILRRWYAHVTGSEPALKMRNWGVYIRHLRTSGVNERILSALEQIKDLHRNPVIHPDSQLTIDEALSFVGIAESIISAICADMKRRTDEAVRELMSAATAAAMTSSMESGAGK